MGLKETLKNQEQLTEQESNSEVLKIEKLVRDQEQTIHELLSQNSEKLAEIQLLQSELTKAKGLIGLLKSRASSVNEIEAENKRLKEETQKVLIENAKSVKEKTRAIERVNQAEQKAKIAFQKAREEAEANQISQKLTLGMERATELSNLRYKRIFVAQSIFTFALAIIFAYGKGNVLKEMASWFPERWFDIKKIVIWLVTRYMEAVNFIGDKWALHIFVQHIIVIVILLIILAGIRKAIIRFEILLFKLGNIYSGANQNVDKTFKKIISVDIALIMLYICLWLYIPIKSILAINIFSSWLMLSILGIVIWYTPQIVKTIKSYV